jgi:hypothetical protein
MVNYYNYLSKNWKSNDNYFFQHYLNNKIYKIYLKNNKLRFNKFILFFIKYYYLKKYMNYRGFWSNYSLDIINLSSFSYILMSYSSLFFKNIFLKPLVKFSNFFLFFIKNKKIGISKKWLYYKYNINLILKNILINKNLNKYRKFFIFYKIFIKNKKFSIKKIKNIYINYTFFFHFYLWNKTFLKYKKNTQILNKRFKFLKKLECNLILLNFIKKALISIKDLKYFYYNKNILNLLNINSYSFLSYYKLFNKNYCTSYFINNNTLNLDKFDLLRFKLKKMFYLNLNTQKYNKKILRWDKQKRFTYINNKPWFNNSKDKILRTLYKPYKFNKFINKIRYNNIKYYKKFYNNIIIKFNFYNKWKYYIFNKKKELTLFKNYYLRLKKLNIQIYKKFILVNNKINFKKAFNIKKIFKYEKKKIINKKTDLYVFNKIIKIKPSLNIYFYKKYFKYLYKLNVQIFNKINNNPFILFLFKNKINKINNIYLNKNFNNNIEFLLKSFNLTKKKNNNYIYNNKLHNILKNESYTSKYLNKKRYLYKYKFNFNDLNFIINSKDYYYFMFLKNNNKIINNFFNNSNIYLNFFKYYKNIINIYIYNINILLNKMKNHPFIFKIKNYILLYKYSIYYNKLLLLYNNNNIININYYHNNLIWIKNLIYNNNLLINKIDYFYLTKNSNLIKNLNIKKNINNYIIYIFCLLKLKEKYKKKFW